MRGGHMATTDADLAWACPDAIPETRMCPDEILGGASAGVGELEQDRPLEIGI